MYRNQQEIIGFIYADAQKDFNYIAYTPPQHDYTWQYNFWRANHASTGVKQVVKTQATMYAIIEPDPGYPDRIKEWFKVREYDGVVAAEKTFPSGILVQTRTREITP